MNYKISKTLTMALLGTFILGAVTLAPAQTRYTCKTRVAYSVDDFDTRWQQIDTFISTHALMASYETKMAIKAETRDGVHTWCCIGPGIGFPTLNGEIVFDSAANAYTCAQMILVLATDQK